MTNFNLKVGSPQEKIFGTALAVLTSGVDVDITR